MAPEATRVTSPNQQPGRPSMASRLSGRQDEDNQRRPQPAARAWGTGVNPITQRYSSTSQPNGVMNKGNSRAAVPDTSGNSDRSGSDGHITVLSQAMGQLCSINLKEGAVFVGILAAVKAKQAETYLLCRMVRSGTPGDAQGPQKSQPHKQYVGHGAEHIMVFPMSQISSIVPSGLSKSVRNAAGKGFMTDTQISGNSGFRERKLEKWQAPADSSLALGNTDSSGEWDQFKVNQDKFGVKSDYDESHYTTVIDKSNPLYAMRERKAAQIAAEIEGDSRSNQYGEQRGSNDEDYDEEDMYSGVRRNPETPSSGQRDVYVPPSRRTQQQAGDGSKDELADPAIISAQVSRKDTTKETKPAQAMGAAAAATPPSQPGDKNGNHKKEPQAAPVSSAVSAKAAAAPAPISTQVGLGSTARGLPDVRTAFKNFANMEKLKVQDKQRRQASHDKAVKVNDLKKFAKNFKLNTPVPKDLLPILAKDEIKQNEIVKKAQEQAEVTKQTKAVAEQKQADAAAQAKKPSEPAASGVPATKAPASSAQAAGTNPNGLTSRLEKTRFMHKNNQGMVQAPSPIPDRNARAGSVPGPVPNPLTSPTRPNARGPVMPGTKLNGKAIEFKPNAMATPFKPGANTNVSSPSTKPATTRPITPNMPQPKFLREAKARDARGVQAKPITAAFQMANTIKIRDTKPTEAGQDGASSKEKEKDTSTPKLGPPFRERVDWLDGSHDGKEHLLPGYKDQFAHKSRSRQQISHPASPGNVARGQHPMHYSGPGGTPGMHPVPLAPQMPPQMHGQPHHFPPTGHYDEHHMRPGMQPFPGPSPRMQNVYPSPMPHGAPMGYPQQGGYMPPGAHGLPPRQYSNGPAGMPGPHMQPPMMVPQGSTGPYMQQPMMPQPGPPYPQPMYPGPPQPNGFPSPGRGAPPMMPSGSHQGPGPAYTPNSQYAQPVYHHPPGHMAPRGSFNGQPHYPQSPYQQQQYPARTPSHGYNQPHQTPVAPAQAPPTQPAISTGDDTK